MLMHIYTLRLHYNAVVEVHEEKKRYNGPRYIHASVVQNLKHDLFHRFSHT